VTPPGSAAAAHIAERCHTHCRALPHALPRTAACTAAASGHRVAHSARLSTFRPSPGCPRRTSGPHPQPLVAIVRVRMPSPVAGSARIVGSVRPSPVHRRCPCPTPADRASSARLIDRPPPRHLPHRRHLLTVPDLLPSSNACSARTTYRPGTFTGHQSAVSCQRKPVRSWCWPAYTLSDAREMLDELHVPTPKSKSSVNPRAQPHNAQPTSPRPAAPTDARVRGRRQRPNSSAKPGHATRPCGLR
jgi:hypothetical protein